MKKLCMLFVLLLISACAAYPVIPALRVGHTEEEHAKLKTAAESGDLDAQYNFGMSYCCGDTALYDNREVTKWLCNAAKLEHTKSQYQIGKLYKGNRLSLPGYESAVRRLPENDKLALAWFIVADSKGHPEAKKAIEMFRHMEFADVVAAIDLSRKYPEIPCEIE